MTATQKIPVHREDDDELLGYAVQDGAGWQAQTFFGYTIARAESKEATEMLLQEQGLSFLLGTWQYFDKEDHDWFPCVLKEAREHQVTVIRTNVLGFQDPEDYKYVIIENPNETNLVKSQ